MSRERATEIEYLKWFCVNADFGPAHSEIVDQMNRNFMKKTGKNRLHSHIFHLENKILG